MRSLAGDDVSRSPLAKAFADHFLPCSNYPTESSLPIAALRRGVVHVWRISLAERAGLPALRPLLSEEERHTADRFTRAELGERYVTGRGWMRRILGAYLGCRAAELRFESGEHGKPRLLDLGAERLEFNLSHSGDTALLAVTRDQQVGIDIESQGRAVEFLDIAKRSFSPAEYGELLELAQEPDLLSQGFFACWVRKEAYLKATGYGISRGLAHFDVTLKPGVPARLRADRFDPGAPDHWELTEITLSPNYRVALAVEAPLDQVMVHEIEDLTLG